MGVRIAVVVWQDFMWQFLFVMNDFLHECECDDGIETSG